MKTKRIVALTFLASICMFFLFWPLTTIEAKTYKKGDWITFHEFLQFNGAEYIYPKNKDEAAKMLVEAREILKHPKDNLFPAQLKVTLVEIYHPLIHDFNINLNPDYLSTQDTITLVGSEVGKQYLFGPKPITIKGSGEVVDEPAYNGHYSYDYNFELNNFSLYYEVFDGTGGLSFRITYELSQHLKGRAVFKKELFRLDNSDDLELSTQGSDALAIGVTDKDHNLAIEISQDLSWYTYTEGKLHEFLLIFRIDEVQLGIATEGETDVIINTDADKDSGETSFTIPEAVATAIIGGAAIAVGASIGASTGSSGSNSGDSGSSDDEEKKKSRYEMRIQKDFGDTIPIGNTVILYARIVEITPDGVEKNRNDLSAKISISSPSYLLVSGESMAGDYKAAYIEAPANVADIPLEATVAFKFADQSGSFTNNVVFKIDEQKIVFGQENLTLPAGYKKTERLPFGVFGMGDNADVSAVIIREDGYSVKVEKGEEEGLYYALIKEINKTEKEAGDYDSYTLEVTAKSGNQSISESLPIYRFYMGLRLDINSIGCYAEEYKASKHHSKKFLFTTLGKQYVPAESNAALTLYDWDIEEHKIIEIAPVVTDFKIEALEKENEQLLEKLAIQCEVLNEVVGGNRGMIFRCCKGALDAPSRFLAKIIMSATYDDEEIITVEKEVLMRSQPYREYKSTEDALSIYKEDKHITERLQYIKESIYSLNYINNLFPLVKFIDVILQGYDDVFGYDDDQIETVKEIWSGFVEGSFKGANAEAETVTFADELKLFIQSFFETAESVEQSLGFMGRFALGVATLGCSHVVFTSLDVAKNMKAYVDNDGDSALEAFRIGAKIVTVNYLTEKAMGYTASKAMKTKTAATIKKKVVKVKDKAIEKAKSYSTAATGKNSRQVITDSVNAGKQAANKANKALETGRGIRKTAEQIELDNSLRAGREFAKEQVENLQAAAWQFELNPTAANRKLLNDLTIKVQESKLAMYALQDYSNAGLDSARKAFNQTLNNFYNGADKIAKDKLASLTGIPTNKIQILNASSSSNKLMMAGKKTTMDRDWTAYYQNSKGEYVYFDQRLTEAVYNDSFYEATFSVKSADASIAKRFAKKTDQTVIEDILGHKESYGGDLTKMLDRSQHSIALNDRVKVRNTVAYKGKEWFAESEKMMVEARKIPETWKRELALAEAQSYKMEGYRQITKQFDNCVNPRDIARRGGVEPSKISDKIRVGVEMCRHQIKPNSEILLTDLENSLTKLGYSADGFADALGDAAFDIG